ncbi:MAG: S8 family serine peptidase [Caldisericia bacterium]|nr:S8 family serine peptidase [Caldisericia bacterium]
MIKKLVITMVLLIMTFSVSVQTKTLTSDKSNDVFVLFENGMKLQNSDPQHIRSISGFNGLYCNYLSSRLEKIDSRIKIIEKFDVISFGVFAQIPDSLLGTVRKQAFVKSISSSNEYEPTGDQSNADLVNASSLYALQDEKSQSIAGKGVIVGVIDSGIDYRHPDLGAGKYGDLGKVIGGMNFISKSDTPIDDDNIGHGTAIAGIIACDTRSLYPGVAPSALLRSYKVFNNIKKNVSEDVIVSALNQAVKDGCNVINISLSSPGTGDQSALAKAAQQAVDAGFIVVGSAGDYGSFNSSAAGSGPVGGAGIADKAICVGASDIRKGCQITIAGKDKTITAMLSKPQTDFPEQQMEIVDGGYGTLDEISSLTLRNKYILVKRGPEIGDAVPYVQKILSAKRKGASGIIIWNHSPGELTQMDVGYNKETGELLTEKDLIPSCFMSYSDGLFLQSQIKTSSTQIKVSSTKIMSVSRFSSMGPTQNLKFKPDLCAPGIGINAPMSMNPATPNVAKYTTSFAGTSASTALVSGACSLLKQLKPSWSPVEVKLALMNTATVLINSNSGDPSSFLIQGAGSIDTTAAANTPAFISPGGIILTGDTKSVKLSIKGITSTSLNISTKVYNGMGEFVKLNASTSSITTSKDKEESVTITADYDPANLPMNAQGMVFFESNGAKLHVPVIIWKEYVGTPQNPVLVANYNNNSFDYTKPDNKITFSFSIGCGDKNYTNPLKYHISKANNDDSSKFNKLTGLNIDLVDGNGDTWITIKRFEDIEYGSYSFTWDGLDAEKLSKVPNGRFRIKLVQIETLPVSGSTSRTISESNLLMKGAVKILGSDIPQPPQFFMMVKPLIPSENQKFVIDVYVTNAKDIGLVKGDIVYPGEEVNVLEVKSGNFLGNDGAVFESDIFIQDKVDEKGISIGRISFNQKRSNDKGADGWGVIARIIAECPKSGNPEITFRNQSLYNSKGEWVNHMASPLILEISTDEPLIGDLNFDGIVDISDIFVFTQSYGLTRSDPDFNILADFNNDGIVDGKDYDILRKNLGKRN